MINKFMDFIFVMSRVGLIAMLGLIVFIMVNYPVIEEKPVQVEQSLDYTDYVNFVNKDEKSWQK